MKRVFSLALTLAIFLSLSNVLTTKISAEESTTAPSTIPVNTITLNVSSLNWTIGKSGVFLISIEPSNATDQTVNWKTSNANVASIDNAGRVKAVGVGKATITCTANDGSGTKATCLITVVPFTPTNLRAISNSYNSIKLNWNAVNSVTGYVVYRYNSSTKIYDKIKVTTTTSFINLALTTNKQYYYKVRAYKTVGSVNIYSGYSTMASAKAVPSIPGSFTAVKVSSTSIKLSWSAVSGASGYKLYRSSTSTGGFTCVKTTTSTSYINSGLPTNRIYYYKLIAYRIVNGVNVYGSFTPVKYVILGTPPRVLFNQYGIKITFTGINYNGIFGPEVKYLIENNYYYGIMVQVRSCVVNGYSIEPICSDDVPSGAKKNTDMTFFNSDLEENGITRIKTLQFQFYICRSDTWDDIVLSNTITLNF